jgi:hypothetical protein
MSFVALLSTTLVPWSSSSSRCKRNRLYNFKFKHYQSSSVRNKTLKTDDQKAYPEVAPHYPLRGFISHVRRKSIISPTGGRRAGAIAPSDLARVVQMHEVTQDNINLSFMVCALKRSVLPLAVRQMCRTISLSTTINNHYRLRI